jgi:hypothetical protein
MLQAVILGGGRHQRLFETIATENELLGFSDWRQVVFRYRLLQLKVATQFPGQTGRIVTNHIEPAASFGPVQPESRNDQLSGRPKSAAQYIYIKLSFLRTGQKVKHGTVVPQAVLPAWDKTDDVLFKPVYAARLGSKPAPGLLQTGSGNVQHREILISFFQQAINQR